MQIADHSTIALAVAASGAELAQPLAFKLPTADNQEWKRQSARQKTKVQLALRILEQAHGMRAARNWVVATDNLGRLCRNARGFSGSRIRAKYQLYVGSGGDWRVLLDNYKTPHKQPPEFVAYLRKLIEENNRSMQVAIEKLRLQIWPSGLPVPGYGTWMEWFLREFPEEPLPATFPRKWPCGWSPSNLNRYAPKKCDRALYQGGLARAHALFPKIKRDTSKLRPLELIVIDDFELDVMCAFRGDAHRPPELHYVCGLMAIDVATRKKLAWGIGPRLTREEKQADGSIKRVRTGVAQVSVQGLIYQLLERHGLPEYECTLLCENATAAIAPELELALSTLFGGRLRVERTSLIEHHTLANGFVERGGTPWEKGWIESEFNYLWNLLGDQPGYKGSNERLNAPAAHDAAVRYTQILLGQGERKLNLPPEKLALLKLPFPSREELASALDMVIARSELRTRHRLIGFNRVTEWYLQPGEAPRPFHELALLDQGAREQVKLVERMESPAERWQRLSAAHPRVRFSADDLAPLLLTPRKVVWKNRHVTFVHQGDGYTYVDAEGDQVPADFEDGGELLGYFDPERPAFLYLSRLTGEFLGTLKLLGDSARGVDITNKERVKEVRALRAAVINRAKADVAARHEDKDAEQAAMLAHNAPLIAPHVDSLPAQTRDALRRTAKGALPTADETPGAKIARIAARCRARQLEQKSSASALQSADELDATKLF